MKVEKINSTQIRVMLTGRDLEEYNIKIHELESDSEKTKQFFREITQTAIMNFDFVEENKPLMVEVMPVDGDNIVLIVSKLDSENMVNEEFIKMIPGALGERAFIRKGVEAVPEEMADEVGTVLLYAFDSLDDASMLCRHIKNVYDSTSSLYKEKGTYYLSVLTDYLTDIKNESFEALMAEYGTRVISNPVSKAYFEEHAEIIIKDKAVEVLSQF